jgi:hypothetical protein
MLSISTPTKRPQDKTSKDITTSFGSGRFVAGTFCFWAFSIWKVLRLGSFVLRRFLGVPPLHQLLEMFTDSEI